MAPCQHQGYKVKCLPFLLHCKLKYKKPHSWYNLYKTAWLAASWCGAVRVGAPLYYQGAYAPARFGIRALVPEGHGAVRLLPVPGSI
eukprot:394085-Rhodomonas_salina.3